MKNIKKKSIEVFLSVIVVTVMLVSLVGAVAFTSDYQTVAPAKVGPGETKEVVFGRLQNMEESDIDVELELTEGSEVATLVESTVTVPAGTTDTEIKLQVSIPEEIAEGTTYKMEVKIKELTAPDSGMVTMTTSKTVSIPILVEEPQTETPGEGISTTWIMLGLVVVLAVIVIVYFMSRRNKSSVPVKGAVKK